MADTSFVLFSLGPVQNFIKAARTVRDLWSGSYLLSYLTFRAMEAVAKQSGLGARAIVFPDIAGLPLQKWEEAGRPTPAPRDVLEPCIPNRFLAEVSGDERHARDLADAAEGACRETWQKVAEGVREFLFRAHGHPSFAPDDTRKNLWHRQIDTFFEVYTAVLPGAVGADRIKALLGSATGEEWADRHQVAQKVLAAVKNRRHFPVYAPTIPGEVPQKDTLLGTLEHVGPGNRQEASRFWERAAKPKKHGGWHYEGSKVTRRERLCAISLVKRFAWAHHLAPLFGYEDPRELKFSDTATIAAKKWLTVGGLDPREQLKRGELWSGQWLHWPTCEPPNDDLDEDIVPPDAWNAIQAKKRTQGKPPTYYAIFVFDGDKMGDRFNAATNGKTYRDISQTLGAFALKAVRPIVERHAGQLIYAGGDDAICALPTEAALACVQEVNAAFRAKWLGKFPTDEPATISGGLVVAHYKEDLRFVLEEARKAEKRSKDAGRNALTVTVCRRSGEHSSATLPWDFVPSVIGWVSGFLAKASDRWAYKLHADLPVVGSDKQVFRLELARQLNRTEQFTHDKFRTDDLCTAFDKHTGSIKSFVTLLQTASFLARGRDE